MRDRLDHHYLNDIDEHSTPTSENLARWMWERLGSLPMPKVEVRETRTSGVEYPGPRDGERIAE